MIGGVAAFVLDMLTQPLPTPVDLWIEPGQWAALVAVLAGALLWSFAPCRKGLAPVAPGTDPVRNTNLQPEPLHMEVR